jgi:large subunit ribosomal protein L17
MKHGHKFNKLNMTTPHRKATLSNMLNSLIRHLRITTTLPKAKELKRLVDKLVNRAKKDTLHNKRMVLRILRNRSMIKKLFTVIAPKFAGRTGGFTRIYKLGKRMNDNAEMAVIEFVESFEEPKAEEGDKKNAKSDSKAKTTEKPKGSK